MKSQRNPRAYTGWRDGVDPSEYRYDAEREAQMYSWYAAKSKARVLHVWFKDGKLYACGAYNLGFPKMS